MSSLQVGNRLGGRQAPRREPLLSLRYGRVELAATLASLLYASLAWYLVRDLGLTTSEALARTARVGTMWDGFDTSLVAFGYDRPPLLTALAAPLGGIDRLREHGLTAAFTTALASGVSVVAASAVARAAGLARAATVLFVAAFALHPLLVYAGAVGLPEMLYTSLVLLALWQFGEWAERGTVSAVITAGVALGIAFLLRYNVLLVCAVMAWAFWWVGREDERRTQEPEAARATMLAFLVPVVFVAGLWTLLAWFPRGEVLGYVRQAADLSRLRAEDLEVVARTADLRLDPLATLRWVVGWSAAVGPASLLALGALAAYGLTRGERGPVALALVGAALMLPEAVALFTGHGQAHVPHLFVMVAPAFAILGFRERRLTRGVRPGHFDRTRRRAQVAWSGGLFLASVGSGVVLALLPASDPPAAGLEQALRTGVAPAPLPADTRQAAAFISAEAGPGGVVADVERHAAVMLAVGDLARFQTDADRGEEATLYEPFEQAQYLLVRRRLPGQGPGRIERAYEDIFTDGAASLALVFESGDYRIYAVTGPALP